MLSMHTSFALPHARREPAAPGIAPALMGGWIGGTILGAMALWFGLGWLAALAAYGLGGARCSWFWRCCGSWSSARTFRSCGPSSSAFAGAAADASLTV